MSDKCDLCKKPYTNALRIFRRPFFICKECAEKIDEMEEGKK